ncbi:MAG: 2-oxoglutarate dehydrogenase, E2 component, dihydrolipoamide succinyltransferase [Intrasporangium sp.]|uniref:2-oxoglutarate dehydrogenase, E2 component, dihydrolipoamide succinyltransferase n=1 Tax=Intrasporangium sp. TaxID=1925024 RepID=UPI003F7EFACA
MPALGESVTEGTVTRWLKNVGDRVEVDEPLLEVSTDKVDTEIPSPVAGTLQEILAQEDDTVPVGADLAVIGDGEAAPSSGAPAQEQAAPAEPAQPTEQAQPAEQAQPEDQPGSVEPQTPGDGQPQQPETQAAPLQAAASGSGEGQTVVMPALGESVTEGTVTRWLKAEGDDVATDEPLLEVSTDKVDTEIPSPFSGKLTKILVAEDEVVPVGGELAVIGGSAPAQAPTQQQAPAQQAQPAQAPAPQEAPAAHAPAEQQAPAPEQAPAQPSAPAPQQEQPARQPEPIGAAVAGGAGETSDAAAYVTPLVRKLAAQHSVDLGSIQGTGVGGRIRKQDVLDAAEAAKQPAPQPEQPAAAAAPAGASAPAPSAPAEVSPKRGTREKMSRLRKVIAQRMVESLQVSAQLTTVVEVDLTKVARLRARAKKDFEGREGTKLSYLPFLALATCEALKAHPNLNASVEGDEIVYHGSENLSIAVDTDKGLIVPVVKNAGDLNIAGLARANADVADRTRSNKITPDDLAGGTFTITNTGSRGALFDTPIINQPQVAILGTGAIVKRPVVVTDADGGETLAIRSMMYLALSYDHRIVDGADAARFLATLKGRLEEGNFDV